MNSLSTLPHESLLQAFFKDNQITLSKHIRISQDQLYSEKGFLVTCKSPFKPGVVLCSIPKSAILSIKNTAIAADLPTPSSKVEHHILLAISLLYEKSLGTSSPWYGYISSLPVSQPNGIHTLPTNCIGTSLFYTLSDYNADINSALAKLNPHFTSINLLFTDCEIRDALSLVTSRAFNVDEFNGDAFVPLADLFNHKSNAEHCHIQSDQEVCVHCGFKFCDCLTESEGEGEKEESEWSDEQSEASEGGMEDNDEDVMEMVAVKNGKKDREVFNTFGEHSNAQLFTLYGFTEKINPNDEAIVHETELRMVVGTKVFVKAKALYLKWEEEIMDFAERLRENNVCDVGGEFDGVNEECMEEYLSEDILTFQVRDGCAPPLRFFLHACLLTNDQHSRATSSFKTLLTACKSSNDATRSIINCIIAKRQSGNPLEPMFEAIRQYELLELKMFSKSLLKKL